MQSFEKVLNKHNLKIEDVKPSQYNYEPLKEVNGLVYISGQVARVGTDIVTPGKVGQDVSVEEAVRAAEICTLRAFIQIINSYGDLDVIDEVIKVNGYVQSAPDFYQQPKVINGASDLIKKLFVERGTHARTAVGVAALPNNSPVEIEIIIKLK